MRRVTLGVMLAFAALGSVIAGPGEKWTEAYDRRDYATAMRLLQPLANQGDASAQFQLGLIYANGFGVPQDYAEAVKWARNAADQGFPAAQIFLWSTYHYGKGVAKDDKKAVEWLRKAADQGYAHAHYYLGFICETGSGVPQDYVQAHKWYNLAAARYLASQTELRAKAVESRNLVEARLTPAQIAKAQRLASEWKPK